jgi:hypothetical protein
LQGEDVARFRELNLLSAAAVLRGQCSLIRRVDLWWARDDFMAAPNLSAFNTTNLIASALAEKAEAVADWEKIEMLARQIHFADKQTQDFVETSCTYGRIKYSIIEQAWTILLYGAAGDKSKNYDCEIISAAIAQYDKLWQEWRTLKDTHPSCATIYKDVAFRQQARHRRGGGTLPENLRVTSLIERRGGKGSVPSIENSSAPCCCLNFQQC